MQLNLARVKGTPYLDEIHTRELALVQPGLELRNGRFVQVGERPRLCSLPGRTRQQCLLLQVEAVPRPHKGKYKRQERGSYAQPYT